MGTITGDIANTKQTQLEPTQLLNQEQIARTEAEPMEQELRSVNQQISNVFNKMTDAFVALDRDWRIIYVNQQTAKLNNQKPEELIGKTHWEQWPWSVGTIVEKEYCRSLALQVPVHFQVFYEPLNIWLEINAYPTEEGLEIYFRDITDRKQTEKILQQSEARYRSLVRATSQAVWTTNAQGLVVDDIPLWRSLTGQSEADVKGQGWMKAIHPEDRQLAIEAWNRAIETKTIYQVEHRVQVTDGSYRFFSARGVPVLDVEGNILEWVGTYTDITERKQAETALEEFHGRTLEILESISDAFYALDKDFCFTYINHKAEELWGRKREDLIGKNIREFPEAIGTQSYNYILQAARERCVLEFETPGPVAGNWLFEKIAPSGSGVSVYLQDISDRKQAEAEIQRLNTQLQRRLTELETLINVIPVGIAISEDPECKVIRPNLYFQKILNLEFNANASVTGTKPETLPSKIIHEGQEIPGEELPMQQAASQKVEIRNWEAQIVQNNGTTFDLLGHAMPLFDEAGDVRGCLGVFMDITERKQAEEALKKQQKWLETVLDLMPTPMIFVEPETARVIFANRAANEIAGGEFPKDRPAEEYDKIYYCTDANGDRVPIEQMPGVRVAKGERIESFEMDWHTPVGIRSLLIFGDTLPAMHGHPATSVVMFQDITSLKQTEKALRQSEARFKSLVESNVIGIVITEFSEFQDNIKLLEANGAFLDIVGYTHEELEKGILNSFEITPAEYKHLDARAIEELLIFGVCTPFEKEFISKSGRRIPVLIGLALLEGYQYNAVGFVIDLTERKQAEKALLHTNQRLKILSETASGLLSSDKPINLIASLYKKLSEYIELDIYFNYIYDENKRMLRLESYEGMSIETIENIEYLEVGQGVCGTVASAGCQLTLGNIDKSTEPQTEFLRSIKIKSYSCQPLMVQGKVFGTLGFGSRRRNKFKAHEITLMQSVCNQIAIAIERSRLISSLQQQTEQLMETNRLKDEFLAVVSHELRSPLNAILGWASMLRSGRVNETTRARAIETIERNARAQSQLIEDLLDVSRIITGKLRLNVRAIQAHTIIEAAIDSIRPAADAKLLQLNCVLDPAAGSVFGDSERLQQVIWNLLSNAVKFTPKGGQVQVLLQRTNSNIEITINDTGIGINPDFLPYVFDRFRQADGTTTRSYGGLGLGLAIVRHIVELHGGTVSVSSFGEGQGSTFVVRLPLMPLLIETETKDLEPVNPTIDTAVPLENTRSLQGVRVIIVDDEVDSREFIALLLQECGAEIKAVASASEALEAIRVWKPDVMVSDIGMPEEDGYSLIRKVRSLSAQQGGKTPAIALTAYARDEDRTHSINEGFQIHLSKPVEAAELITVVANLANPTPK